MPHCPPAHSRALPARRRRVVAAGCGGSDSDTETGGSDAFRLGLEAPLSGEQSVLGKGMLKGAELAADAAQREAAGSKARKSRSSRSTTPPIPKPESKRPKPRSTTASTGSSAPTTPASAIETLPLYIDAGLVPVRLTSDNSTNGLGYTLQPMTYQIAPVASEALTDWLGAKKVAIAYDPTQGYTLTVSKAVKESLEEAGVEITAYEKVKPGEDDYTDVVDKLAADQPRRDLRGRLLPRGRPDRQGDGRRQRRGPVRRRLRLLRHRLRRNRRGARRPRLPGRRRPGARRLRRAPAPLRRRIPKSASAKTRAPGAPTPTTRSNFLADGIAKAGGTDAAKLEKALDAVKGWKGWTGSVTIDPKNGNRDPATVVIVETDAKGKLHVDEAWAKAVGAPY